MNFEATTVLGTMATAYGLASVVAPLLQLRQMRARGSSADLSLGSLGIAIGGSLLWLSYGISLANVALIVVDLGTLITGLATMAYAMNLRRQTVAPLPHRMPATLAPRESFVTRLAVGTPAPHTSAKPAVARPQPTVRPRAEAVELVGRRAA